jgi:broad specificity phosphatase PhoE
MDPTEKLQQWKRRRIYLMRHGDVSYFDAAGRPLRPDTVPLNDAGRLQAEAAGRLLADVPIDRVVASDLLRSIDTASLATGGRSLKLETYEQLREIQPGRLADIPADDIETAFTKAFASDLTPDARFLGGETLGSLIDRVHKCFASFLADKTWNQLLIVAHGGVNRVILAGALGVGLQAFAAFEQDPGCLNILDVDSAGRLLVRLVNYTPDNPIKKGLELTTMESLYLQYCHKLSGS